MYLHIAYADVWWKYTIKTYVSLLLFLQLKYERSAHIPGVDGSAYGILSKRIYCTDCILSIPDVWQPYKYHTTGDAGISSWVHSAIYALAALPTQHEGPSTSLTFSSIVEGSEMEVERIQPGCWDVRLPAEWLGEWKTERTRRGAWPDYTFCSYEFAQVQSHWGFQSFVHHWTDWRSDTDAPGPSPESPSQSKLNAHTVLRTQMQRKIITMTFYRHI
jgi:hypothetical protein